MSCFMVQKLLWKILELRSKTSGIISSFSLLFGFLSLLKALFVTSFDSAVVHSPEISSKVFNISIDKIVEFSFYSAWAWLKR